MREERSRGFERLDSYSVKALHTSTAFFISFVLCVGFERCEGLNGIYMC